MKKYSPFIYKKRIIGLVLSLILILAIFAPINIFASNNVETIKVGFFAFDGYHEIDENGNKSGYGYDFLTLMKRYANINYEYIGYDKSWSDMQQMLLDGEIDMVTSAHKTADREKIFDFSLPIGSNCINLNVSAEETRYIPGDYSTYNEMKVGMIENSSSNDRFDEFAKDKGFSYTAKYYSNTDELEEALQSGKVDAVVSSSLRKIKDEAILDEFNTEYFYAIVRKGDTDLLDEINYAILQMNSNEGDWKNTLYYNNYLSENYSTMHFTDEERAFIQKYSNGTDKLVFAIDTNWVPFSWKENGEYIGILPDIVSYCMNQCGIEYIFYDSKNEIVDATVLEDSQIDMYVGYSMEGFDAENDGLVASDTILDCGTAYLVRKETTEIKTIAICSTTPYLNTRLQNIEGITIKEYPDTLSAKDAVLNKKVDAAFLYDYDAQYTANHDLKGSLAYELVSDKTIQIKAVIRNSDDRTLMSVWTKCFNNMTKAEENSIISEYISHSATNLTIKDYALLNPFLFFGMGLIVLVLILIAIFAFIKNGADRKHKVVLEEKISEITTLNDQLQDNQTRLEESVAEQEAQLEEISALNGELEENQARLEEASSEQEAQIEEVTALNTELENNRNQLERQLEVIGATSNRYFCAYIFNLNNNTYHEVFTLPNMHEMLGSEGDAIKTLELAWRNLVIPEDQDIMREFHDITKWKEYLQDKEIYSVEYRGVTSGWSRASLYAGKRENGEVTSIVYTLERIHEQKETEMALAAHLSEIERLNELFKETQDHGIRSLLDQVIQRERESALIDHLVQTVGNYYNADRAYIFERDITGQYTVNTYEWCAEGVSPEIDNLQEVPINVVDPWMDEFRKKGSFYISCDDEYAQKEPIVYEVLEPQGITSLMAAPMIVDGDIIGFIGVDNPKENLEHELYLSVAATAVNHERQIILEKLQEEKYKKELEKSREAAQLANEAKTSFLFNMSHDIRTPMNAIIGYANLIKSHSEDKEKCLDYLNKIISSSDFLLDLINDVLELARIESGKMILDETTWNTIAFNDSLYAVFAEGMEQKNITYTRTIDIWNEYVFCDSVKVREIFLNLISNAMKYTPVGGKVHMALKELPSDREGYALMQTTISDTGIGMSAEYLPHLFEKFTREKSVTENKIQGTGLGMPIVKNLVELMDGSISVESEIGKGTTFVVKLYHKISSAEAMKKQDITDSVMVDFTGKRFLLAEDNDLNAEIATEIIKETGAEIERAEDGIECIDMLRKSEIGYYDLILMDIQMPNLDGYKATEKIRRAGLDIPIIAMTANAFEEDKKKAIDVGMNGHIAKPIKVDELMRTLSEILG